MFTENIPQGKLVLVTTIGSKSRDKAPSLKLTGKLVEEIGGINNTGYINLEYKGEKALLNDRGKVIGYQKGPKIMSIPRSIVASVASIKRKESYAFM